MSNSEKVKVNKTTFKSKIGKKRSKWSIILASVISALAIGGSVTAIYFSTVNYNISSQYGKSYNTTFGTSDTSYEQGKSFLFEDPCMDYKDTSGYIGSHTDEYENQIENAYSSYLAGLQINDFDVKSTYQNDVFTTQATLPNHKFHDPDDTDNKNSKIDQSPADIYFNDTSSSRISLLYANNDDHYHQYSSIITPETYLSNYDNVNFQKNSKIQLSNDKKSVYVKINQDIGTKLEEGLKKPESSNGDDDTTPKDQVYIINDINGLINRMWTDIQVYYYYNNRPEKLEDSGKYMDMLTNSYKNMKVDGDYDFADAYFKLNPNPGDPYTWAQAFCNDDTSDGVRFQGFLDNGNSPSSQIHWCSQFYKWIDGSKSDTGWTYKSKTNYNFMNKYVMGIVKSDSVATFIPEKDPTSPKNKADHQWMVIGDSMNNAHKIYNAYKKYQFSLPQQNLAFNLGNSGFSFDKSDSSLTKINQMGLFGQINTSIMEQKNLPTFSNSWYKGSPLLSSIIAIVAVIVLVGVLISILYRIPWLLALGCILLTLSVTVFLMLFGGYAISIGFFAGILAVLACSTLTACLFMERMKKQIKNGITPLLGFKRTVRNTILQGIDIHFVSLLVGVLFIFMGNLDLNTMGMFISIGTLFSVLFVLCLWPLISWGIYFGGFKNIKLMMMVGKIKAINATDTQQNQLQTTFTDNKLKWKLNIFNRLAKIIMAVILSAIVVLGVILLTCNSNQSIIKALSNKAIGEYCLSSFYAWMISVSLIALYGLIRLNWTTFVPLLVTLILNSLIPFMLIVITQIPVNSINPEFIIAIALSYQFSAMLTIIFAHNFNNSWIRNHLLSKKLLKNVLNKEILNSLPYLLLTSGITIGSILVSLVLSSNSLLWVYLISLIFVLCSMVMIFSVLPWLLYVFINLRYRYIGGSQRKLDNTFEKRNYDEVDEQEIKDINRFTRAKATI